MAADWAFCRSRPARYAGAGDEVNWREGRETMTGFKLKRVTISSPAQLDAWLGGADGRHTRVMLVTHADATNTSHVPRDVIRDALSAHRWVAERSYTLNGGLLGHVIRRA
ncbi:MAG: hypothetical protein CMH11_14080 [Maritimibacter sp.]|nr:hypothetical protein [Maritimibacter sp.]